MYAWPSAIANRRPGRPDRPCAVIATGNRAEPLLLEGSRLSEPQDRQECQLRVPPKSAARPRRPRSPCRVDIDGTGRSDIATGVGFFDHMLDQLSRHSLIDMTVEGQGRPAHRRPPHGRGYRHRDRPGAVEGARRAARHHALRLDRPRHGRDADARRDRRVGPAVPGLERAVLARPRSAPSTPNWCASSSTRWRRMPASRCTSTNLYGANNHHIAETCFKAVARVLRAATGARSAPAGRGAVHQGQSEGLAMAIYVVMEPPGSAGSDSRRRAPSSSATAFALLAFLVPPLWLLWHRLWIEAALAFAARLGLTALGEVAGLGFAGRRAVAAGFALCRAGGRRRFGSPRCAAAAGTNGASSRPVSSRRGRDPLPCRPWTLEQPVRATVASRHSSRRSGSPPPCRPGARPARLSGTDADMRVAIIDYGSGNLRSATKAFERAAREAGIAAEIDLTADAERVRERRPHRAARRRRLCRLPPPASRRRRHVGGDRRGGDRARPGPSSASASACS